MGVTTNDQNRSENEDQGVQISDPSTNLKFGSEKEINETIEYICHLTNSQELKPRQYHRLHGAWWKI